MNLTLEIITPEKVVYKNEINELVAPTVNGQIAILPNHVGLFTKIIPGELIIRKANSQEALAVTGGFLEVAKAQEAQRRAEKLMAEKTSERDFRMAQADLVRAITELRVATKYKRKASKPTEV